MCGIEFSCLRTHWLVGLKFNHTFGQISAYMGWVKQSLAKQKDVRGIIVANSFEEKLKYAVALVPNIRLKRYARARNLLRSHRVRCTNIECFLYE